MAKVIKTMSDLVKSANKKVTNDSKITFDNATNDLKSFGRGFKYYRKYTKGELLGVPDVHIVLDKEDPAKCRIVYLCTVIGENGRYSVILEAQGVEYSAKRKTELTMVTYRKGERGRPKRYFYSRPSLRKNKFRIRSDDPDFRFRFMRELARKGGLYPSDSSWVKYDPKEEDASNGVRRAKYYRVSHPQGGSYFRRTPHPKKGGRPFMNPKGFMGYSYPIAKTVAYLLKQGIIGSEE